MYCDDAANLVLIFVPDICQTQFWYQFNTVVNGMIRFIHLIADQPA